MIVAPGATLRAHHSLIYAGLQTQPPASDTPRATAHASTVHDNRQCRIRIMVCCTNRNALQSQKTCECCARPATRLRPASEARAAAPDVPAAPPRPDRLCQQPVALPQRTGASLRGDLATSRAALPMRTLTCGCGRAPAAGGMHIHILASAPHAPTPERAGGTPCRAAGTAAQRASWRQPPLAHPP